MTATGKWFCTPHAVQRYREITPGLTYEQALADLIRESESLHVVRTLDSGALLCRGPRPRRLRFRLRRAVVLAAFGVRRKNREATGCERSSPEPANGRRRRKR